MSKKDIVVVDAFAGVTALIDLVKSLPPDCLHFYCVARLTFFSGKLPQILTKAGPPEAPPLIDREKLFGAESILPRRYHAFGDEQSPGEKKAKSKRVPAGY